jgi:hypothetical protein
MQSGRAARLGLPAPASASDAWAAQVSDLHESGEQAGPSSAFTPRRKTTGESGYRPAAAGGYGDAGYGDAGYGDAGYGDAGYGDAGYGDAGYGDAGYSDAGYSDAGYGDIGYSEDRLPESRFAQESAFGPAVSHEPEPTVRQTFVAGSPPWEPAPEPTTALPWAPSTQRSGGFRPAAPRPDSLDAPGGLMPRTSPPGAGWSEPPARASEPPRSLFDPGPVLRLSAPTPGAHDAPDADASPHDSGSRPIYVWNPSSTTGDLGEGRDGTTDWLSIGQDSDLSAVLTSG